MALPDRWAKGLRPDPAVLDLIELLRVSAASGQLRTLAVVTVDPLLNVETAKAGDCDLVRKRLLAAGLFEAAHKIVRPPQ